MRRLNKNSWNGMERKSELLELKRKALENGLCDKYKVIWDGCHTKRDLVNTALDSNGVEFMADSIAFGWGLSKEYLMREFGEYMNGYYQRSKGGYTGELYVGAHGVVKLKSTITLVAYCDDLEIDVPEHFIGQVYICGGSKVRIENMGTIELYEYGTNDVEYFEYLGANSTLEAIRTSKWINCTSDNK